jgi:hypothetical protein
MKSSEKSAGAFLPPKISVVMYHPRHTADGVSLGFFRVTSLPPTAVEKKIR